jgi:hypothetical protein
MSDMHKVPNVTRRDSLAGARAFPLPAPFDPDLSQAIPGGLPQHPLPDRLAWPVAAVIIAVASLGLWLVLGGVARLVFG